MSHEDFKFVDEKVWRKELYPEGETVKPVSDKPLKPAEIARLAAGLAYRIESEDRDPANWKARIEAAPPELRECLTEYMRQRWRALKERERRAAGGKKSAAGDAAMAELGKRYGR